MAELFGKLGIDWKLLIAQVVNLAIVFWVLKRFAYKPILQVLERRSQRIAQSMRDATAVAQERKGLVAEKERMLSEARAESGRITDTARKDAEAYLDRTKQEARADTEKMKTDAKKDIARMKDAIVDETRGDLADLIMLATEKVVRIKLDHVEDRRMIEDVVQKAKEKIV
jgi:F-type H+-transporting ATPase subunit b